MQRIAIVRRGQARGWAAAAASSALALGAWLASAAPPDAAAANEIRGWIVVERDAAKWTFAAMADSRENAQIRYELSAVHKGSGGKSQTAQSGRQQLLRQQARELSRTTLSIHRGDDYCVVLRVFAGDELVARDLAFPGAPAETRSAAPERGAAVDPGPTPPKSCDG